MLVRGVLFLLVLCICGQFVTGNMGTFTSHANLEKLYTLEDELIAIADIVLDQERILHGDKDTHDFSNFTSTIRIAKDIHKGLINNKGLTNYLHNPISAFQLIKRLTKDWRKIVDKLLEGETCQKLMREKVANIKGNIPSEDQLNKVAESILTIQIIYDISVEDLVAGKILGEQTDARLTAEDALDVARVASIGERFSLVVQWVKVIMKHYSSDDSLDKIGALNLLSSALYKLGKNSAAVAALDVLLNLDPTNAGAMRNKEFLESKPAITPGYEHKNLLSRSKKERLLTDYCSGQGDQNTTRQSRLFCTYLPERGQGMFIKPEIKTEVLSTRPLIVLFHDVTNTSQQKAIQYLGYEGMRDLLLKNEYQYSEGVGSVLVHDYTRYKWIPRMVDTLNSIPLSYHSPSPTRFMVTSVGTEGYETQELTDNEKKYRLGTFIVFLSEAKHGGDFVFPSAKVKVEAKKWRNKLNALKGASIREMGSVLFFDSKVHDQATICPAVLDTEWVGIYPLFDNTEKTVCDVRRLQRPQRL